MQEHAYDRPIRLLSLFTIVPAYAQRRREESIWKESMAGSSVHAYVSVLGHKVRRLQNLQRGNNVLIT